MSLSWITPNGTGGHAIMNYVITLTPLDSSDPWNISIIDNSTSYTVIRLMFGYIYILTVRASSCLEVGKESNLVTVT